MVFRAIPQSLLLHKCCISTTEAEVNVDTVVFFPKQIDFPAVTIDNFLTQAAEYIVTILINTPAPTVLSIETGGEPKNDLLKLAYFL